MSAKSSELDFKAQAEQMLHILEERMQVGDLDSVKQLLVIKFKSLYELGVSSGRLYEREGVYPYTSLDG